MKFDPNGNPDANGNATLTDTVKNNVDRTSPDVVKSLTETAGKAADFNVRADAVMALGAIVEQKSDPKLGLVDASLAKNVTQIAEHDPDSMVRAAAQQTLGKIAERRPDLVDAHTLEVVSKTAAAPAANHPEQKAEGWTATPKTDDKGRQWTQDDIDDNHARATAQNTLKVIAEKRPDPHAAASNGADQHVAMTPPSGLTGFSGATPEKHATVTPAAAADNHSGSTAKQNRVHQPSSP